MSVEMLKQSAASAAEDDFPMARVSSNGTITWSNAVFDKVVSADPRMKRILAPDLILNCLESIPYGSRTSTTVSLPEITVAGVGMINSLMVRRAPSGAGMIELLAAAPPLEVQMLRDMQMHLIKLDSTRKPIAMFKWALLEPEIPGDEPLISITSDFHLSPTVGSHVDFMGPISELDRVAHIINRDEFVTFGTEFLKGNSPEPVLMSLIDQDGISRAHIVSGQRIGASGIIASGVALDVTNWAKVGSDLEAEERLAISSVELSALQQELSNTATMLQSEAYLQEAERGADGTSELGQLADQTATAANVLAQVVSANTQSSRKRYVPQTVDGAIDKQIIWAIMQSARRQAAGIPIKCECETAEGYRPTIEPVRMRALTAKLVQHASNSVRVRWRDKAESAGSINLDFVGGKHEDRRVVSVIVSDNGKKADLFEGSDATDAEYDRHWNLIRTQIRALRGDLIYWYDKKKGNCYRLCIPCHD